jgi:hypothetical protein
VVVDHGRNFLDPQGGKGVREGIEGRKNMATDSKSPFATWAILCGVALIIILIIWGSMSSERQNVDTAMIEKNMKIFNDLGLIVRLQPDLHEVQVNGLLWAGITYDNKKKVAATLAEYCAWKDNESAWVVLKDSMTGKRLGKYGYAGFEPTN